MKYILAFTFILLFVFSCNRSPVETHEEKPVTVNSSPGDTLKMDGAGLLFMCPDSLQAEQMKSKDSDAFYTIADDISFYNSQLMDLADSMKIKSYSTSERFLDFSLRNNKHLIVDRSSSEELWWGLYLYNELDTPRLENTVDIDATYLHNYFNK
jgi:hypothetical protein